MLRLLFIVIILISCLACTNTSGKSATGTAGNLLHTTADSKVLIELFTSQGCSSCPAADKLIGSLVASDTNVIALSFHVDYWDRLGWKDVFSSHEYTLRQQQYVQALHAKLLYTPQAVVQGSYEMVGSNRVRIADAIKKIKATAAAQSIAATAIAEDNSINVNYHLSQILPSQQLVIALVQNKTITAVAKGENANNNLVGVNVVRSLQSIPAWEAGSLHIDLPGDLQKDNASVVLFIQNGDTQQVATVLLLHL